MCVREFEFEYDSEWEWESRCVWECVPVCIGHVEFLIVIRDVHYPRKTPKQLISSVAVEEALRPLCKDVDIFGNFHMAFL